MPVIYLVVSGRGMRIFSFTGITQLCPDPAVSLTGKFIRVVMFNSYRSRLIALMAAVIALVALVILTSYTGARWAIQEDAATSLRNAVQLYEHSLEEQRVDLARVAATIREDSEVADYVFAAARIGTGEQALARLLKRRFSRVPVDGVVILWPDGGVTLGDRADEVAEEISDWPMSVTNNTFYIERKDALYMVAVIPLVYRGEEIARVAVFINLAGRWLERQETWRMPRLFFERDGRLFGGRSVRFDPGSFDTAEMRVTANGEAYRLARVSLPAAESIQTRLWLAEPEMAMVKTLDRYNRIMIWLSIAAFLIIVPVALIVVNRFSRPIHKLITLTQQMADGQLPILRRSQGYTEIDRLLNHFIDLIAALRRKQEEVEKAHEALLQSSITDELTGLYNRRHLNEMFPKLLAQASRDGACIAVILLDIDHFKRINDTYGHAVGDRCLKVFSEILRYMVRASDFVFRMGGEEFLILASGHCDQDAALLAEKVRLATENHVMHVDGQPVRFTVSAGVCSFRAGRSSGSEFSDYITCADHALYSAKQAGRNRVRVHLTSGQNLSAKGGFSIVKPTDLRRQE